MDCCNYVEAYAPGGHFYQQHYFCYDNVNNEYGGYEPPPISSAIETSARYNGAVPPAYPTDYVYNPKEARLRKAMREQSRELSRRSILQSAIARAGVITGPVGAAGFLDQQHRVGCMSTGSLPMNSSVEADRVEPWFQSASRPKLIHSPRMTDWYGNVADPIERLQVMNAMHQRSMEKCKDVMRNQAGGQAANAGDCGGATFSNGGYPIDFSDVNRERELRRDNMEYSEFADGQKWHPYQNGGGAHQHPRTSHPSQMGNVVHPSIQSPGAHGHGPWSQFCHNVLPHAPPMPRNVGVRGPRHTVLLRDRLPARHCEFSEETARIAYTQNKIDMENVRASYTPPEHQMPRLLEPSVDSVIDPPTSSRIRREDDGPRWEPSAINNRMSMDNLAPAPEANVQREKERESRRQERFEPKKKTVSKQPLPGFHQAFGSTEIGRFSRSEFFVNMVGESGGSVEVADTDSANLLPKPYLSAPIVFPFSSRSCGILGTSAAIHRITENGEILSRIMPEQCCWFATQSRCGVSRISDNVMNCTAFLDCSHHARDKEWFCQNSMNHSSDVLRQRENYETFASERGDGNYVIIGTPGNADRNGGNSSQNKEFANDTRRQTILKMENGSPKQQNASSGKKNV